MNEAQTKDTIPVHQIVAMDVESGIGIGENLPWNLPKDWNHFLRMTTKVKVFPLKQKHIFTLFQYYELRDISTIFDCLYRMMNMPMLVGFSVEYHLRNTPKREDYSKK